VDAGSSRLERSARSDPGGLLPWREPGEHAGEFEDDAFRLQRKPRALDASAWAFSYMLRAAASAGPRLSFASAAMSDGTRARKAS
jgi:hypothetical protein